jgi:hypothetical protein
MTGLASRAVVAVVLCIAATLANAALAAAQVEQTPKNGCESPEAYEGSLTSPTFTPGFGPLEGPPQVRFQGWFEVESVNPESFDIIQVEYSLAPGEGQPRTWEPLGELKDQSTAPSPGSDELPYSNNGVSVSPTFQGYTFELPAETLGLANVQIRIRFSTGDGTYQGFRGVAVDQISIDREGSDLTEGFESGAPGWTFDEASGAGGPFWQPLDKPQNISVKNPEVNPDLVTLPDSGALPAAAEGTQVAWFGNVDSGTFCGPDFALRAQPEIVQPPPPDTTPPETTIVTGPPTFSEDHTATFSFASSEAGSRFECSLDDGPFVACSSPFTTARLDGGRHTLAVRAIDAAGNVDPTSAVYVFQIALELADLPAPTLGRNVNVQVVSGTVLVALPAGAASSRAGARASQQGRRFVPLEEAQQIPVGSYLDTKRGTVKLVSARGTGSKTQSGRFSKGIFSVGQTRTGSNRGLTTLKLRGGNFRRCRAGASASGAASAAKLSKRTIRRLNANAKGKFRGSGKNSVGTTRGTVWITKDRCDGTLTKVTRGKLSVRDLRRKRTITLRAGQSYLAKAPGG